MTEDYRSKVATIDPGITGTGVAIWDEEEFYDPKVCAVPIECKNFAPSSKCETWLARVQDTFTKVQEYIDQVGLVSHIYCEYQEFFEANSRGRAAQQRGDITKLTFFTGILWWYETVVECRPVELILPHEWRGQLSDPALKQRIISRLGEQTVIDLGITSHCVDAVGIGLWKQGRLTLRERKLRKSTRRHAS